MRSAFILSNRYAGGTALRVIALSLTMATAAIHLTMGGLLFTLNAIGYATLALALVLPGPIAPIRWLVKLALLGFTLATIGGWLILGARFPLAYADKAIEVGLILILAADVWLTDGGPVAIARRLLGLPAAVARGLGGRI